jgi:TolB-like protein
MELGCFFNIADCFGGLVIVSLFSNRPLVENKEKSIAVLPFRNLSADKNDEYFSEGVCNEIVTQLAKIRELRVVSRVSSAQYENNENTFSKIAKELGVDFILKGSVQKDSDKVRISLQLINGGNDEYVWAETYDREMKDIFVIQSDIARVVANELHATLSTDEKHLIGSFSTSNIEAYKDYLQGNYFLDKRTPEGMLRSKAFFENAIEVDSNFDAAYVGLAYSYIFRSNFYNINLMKVTPWQKNWLPNHSVSMPTFQMLMRPSELFTDFMTGIFLQLKRNSGRHWSLTGITRLRGWDMEGVSIHQKNLRKHSPNIAMR